MFFFNAKFKTSPLCENELIYAEKRNKRIVAINMDQTDWCNWLNFYFADCCWIKMANENAKVDDIAGETMERILDSLKHPLPMNQRFHTLNLIDVPSFPFSFKRKHIEDQILNELRNGTVKNPHKGPLYVIGESGVGKTHLVAQILRDRMNADFLIVDCGVQDIIWFDCLRWKNEDSFSPNDQQAVIDGLLKLCERAACQNSKFSRVQFFDFKGVFNHFKCAKRSILIVLDNVYHRKILQLIRKEAKQAPCIVISPTLSIIENQNQPFIELNWMETWEVYNALEMELGLTYLNHEQLRELSKLCVGHPLLASLFGAVMNSCKIFERKTTYCQILLDLMDKSVEDKLFYLISDILQQGTANLNKLSDAFYAILLFEPEAPLKVEELAILWGCEGEDYDKGVLRSRGLCRVLERCSLIQRLEDYWNGNVDAFSVQKQIYELTVRHAKENWKAWGLDEVRQDIINGKSFTNVIEADGMNRKHSMISIAGEAIVRQQRFLLEKMIEKLTPENLAQLCSQKLAKTGGKSFIHLLYNTDWPDNHISKYEITNGINHSYRMIAEIFRRIVDKCNLRLIVLESDQNYDSFLTEIFTNENSRVYQRDREEILKFVQHWKKDYEDVKIEKERIDIYGAHPGLIACRNGDFATVKKLFSSTSFTDPNTDEEIDRVDLVNSALLIAARHGRDIFTFLLAHHYEDNYRYLYDTGRMFNLAAANGHADIVSALFGKPNCDGFAKDGKGRTATMYASGSNSLSVIEYIFVYSQDPSILLLQDNEGKSPLMFASSFGHYRCAEAISRMNPKTIEQVSSDNWTPLHFAAENGHDDLVTLLAQLDPTLVKAMTKQHQQLPIMLAAKNGHFKTIKCLVTLNPETVKVCDSNQWPAFMFACESGDMETIEFLYQQWPDALNTCDIEGMTCLMVASKNGRKDAVRFILQKGLIDVKALSKEEMSSFMYAAFYGHLDVVKLLVAQDPTVMQYIIRNNRKLSALAFAVMKGHLHVIQFLYYKYEEEFGKDRNDEEEMEEESFMLLMSAILTGHLDVVKFLSEQHPQALRYQDSEGQTAMLAAAIWGFSDIVQYLFEQNPGAVDMMDHDGCGPFAKASAKGVLPAVKFLYDERPDLITNLTTTGATCLMMACEHGKLDVAEFIMTKCSDLLLETDQQGVSCLMLSCGHGHLNVVKFLCDKGKDTIVKMKDNQGLTCLMHAAKSGRFEICEYLCSNYVEIVTWADADGMIALSYAAFNGHLKIVELLWEKYNDGINARTKLTGKSPIHLAVESNKIEIAKFFYYKCPESLLFKDIDSKTPMVMVIEFNFIDLLKELVDICPNIVKEQDEESGMLLLTHATIAGFIDAVEFLYEKCPNALTVESKAGKTATSYAAELGWLQIVEFFFNKNRDTLEKLDSNGNLPLTYACRFDHTSTIKFISDNLLPRTVQDALSSGATPETLAYLCRFSLLETDEDWRTLLTPAQTATKSQIDEETQELVFFGLQEVNSNDLARCLEIVRILIQDDVQCCAKFVNLNGLLVNLTIPLTCLYTFHFQDYGENS